VKFLTFVEAETGEVIVTFTIPPIVLNTTTHRFTRRYWGEKLAPNERVIPEKRVIMVRSRETGRFIRMIRGIMVEGSMVFEYPKGKHGNPLYVDVKISTLVSPDDIDKMDDIENRIETTAKSLIESYFGYDVKERAKIVGYEHKAEPEVEVGIPPHIESITEMYPNSHYWVVWHHYKGDEKEEDGKVVL
jgi:hypothetical protein